MIFPFLISHLLFETKKSSILKTIFLSLSTFSFFPLVKLKFIFLIFIQNQNRKRGVFLELNFHFYSCIFFTAFNKGDLLLYFYSKFRIKKKEHFLHTNFSVLFFIFLIKKQKVCVFIFDISLGF